MSGFFHELHQNDQLHRLTTMLAYEGARTQKAADRINALAGNVGEVNLLVLVTLRILLDKNIISWDEVRAYLAKLDGLDGKVDGKITLDTVRAALGLQPPPPPPQPLRIPGGSIAARSQRKNS